MQVFECPLTNADGSATIYFGPKAPAGQEGNWIQTMPGKGRNVIPAQEYVGKYIATFREFPPSQLTKEK